MNKKIVCVAAMMVMAMMPLADACLASAWSLKDTLGGGGVGETVSNLIQGVFSKSDLTVADIAGKWTSNGSAVSFTSDNFLQKAGGVAAAAAIETKLNPYYEQYGLNGAVMTINTDGTFTFKLKAVTLKGTATSNGGGTFEFNFKAFGSISLGSMTTYVEKSGNHLDIMFDASKLKTLISGIARFSGNTLASTAASLLDSYEGMCVGFGMDKTGSSTSSEATTEGTATPDASDGLTKAAGSLLNILKGKGE